MNAKRGRGGGWGESRKQNKVEKTKKRDIFKERISNQTGKPRVRDTRTRDREGLLSWDCEKGGGGGGQGGRGTGRRPYRCLKVTPRAPPW